MNARDESAAPATGGRARAGARIALIAAVAAAAGAAAMWAWMPRAAAPVAGGAGTGEAAPERKVLYWYDPMVPSQKFDRPGRSPFMDMDLVPKYADEAGEGTGVAIDPRVARNLGVRLAEVVEDESMPAVTVAATVTLNERDVAVVQTRSGGFVERTYGHAPGDVVRAGAPLADLLVPEWAGAQQEYLAVRAAGDAALVAAARQRLLLLGIGAAQVERLEASGQVATLSTVVAPLGGVLQELSVRTGMTLMPGATLARINGLATVWVEAALPEAQAAGIAPGQVAEAVFPALPGETVRGRVAAILPVTDAATRTLRVRIELPNRGGRLRGGMLAQVALRGPAQRALRIPAEAVIRTGRRTMVYVAGDDGRYRPVAVELGADLGDTLVVRSGLAAGQKVVAAGQFLIDSEASLQGLLEREAAPAAAPPAATAPAPAAAHAPAYDTRGTVVAVDGGEITLKHDPVPALKWPAMTMPFRLAQPPEVEALKLAPGEAVRFSFTQDGDDWVVQRIEREGGGVAR